VKSGASSPKRIDIFQPPWVERVGVVNTAVDANADSGCLNCSQVAGKEITFDALFLGTFVRLMLEAEAELPILRTKAALDR
jgi:hypothetical protein